MAVERPDIIGRAEAKALGLKRLGTLGSPASGATLRLRVLLLVQFLEPADMQSALCR